LLSGSTGQGDSLKMWWALNVGYVSHALQRMALSSDLPYNYVTPI